MKPTVNFRPLLSALCALGVSAGSASAAVAYFDDFTTGTSDALNGQALVTPSTTAWSASNWQKNLTTNSATNGSTSGSAMVPISFNEGDIVTVTVRVVNNTTGTGWVAMGFSNGSIANNGLGGRNWTTWRGDDVLRVHGGNATVVFNGDLSFTQEGESNTLDLRVVYDFDAGSMTWFHKNPSASDWTQYFTTTSLVSGMTHVGFANNTGNVAVQSFEVTLGPDDPVADSAPNLVITKNPDTAGTYDFEWESQPDKLYDLLSSTDLATPVAEWPVYDDGVATYGDIPGDGGVTTLTAVPSADPRRFFALNEFDAPPPPPIFSADFEENDGGFTATVVEGTAWAWGTPASTDSGGTPNPGGSVTGGNGGSDRCWGTGIGNPGFYANPTTDSCLRSPDIDLTGVSAAELTFAEALDVQADDAAVLRLMSAADDSEIATVYTADDGDPTAADWAPANGGDPIDLSAGAGQTVYLLWCLSGTGGSLDDFMGWYIDDVVVTGN